MAGISNILNSREEGARFCTTRWTVVLNAGGDGPERAKAMEQFCKAYWYPVYAFIRRRGSQHEEACDLAQGFFAKLLEKEWLAAVERRETRFSTLLLTILKRYLVSEYRVDSRLKRGGGTVPLSLEVAQSEEWYGAEPSTDETPERIFARRWALAVMDAATSALRARATAAGKLEHFTALCSFLVREPKQGDYEAVAQVLGIRPAGVSVAVHRLRAQYRDALREELGAGVISTSEVDAELENLAAALR